MEVQKPSTEEAASLVGLLPELHRRAAEAISSADVLLVICGAGWSVPSGLKTYDDVAGDYSDGTTYEDLCDPGLLARGRGECSVGEPLYKRQRCYEVDGSDDQSPRSREIFYGFWGGCYNAYQASTPHPGYGHIIRWRGNLRDASSAFFCLTSNVDGHWRRSLPSAEQLEEFNGTCEFWRCVSVECARKLAAQADPACPGGLWMVPPGFRFAVDPQTHLALDGPPLAAAAAAVGSAQLRDGDAFARNHPRCVVCGGDARPSVKMFNDSETYLEPSQPSHRHFLEQFERQEEDDGNGGGSSGRGSVDKDDDNDVQDSFRHEAPRPPRRAVVFEVGCGPNVRTMRYAAARAATELREGAGAHVTLVRVNVEYPLCEDQLSPGVDFIPLMEDALEATQAIDALVSF